MKTAIYLLMAYLCGAIPFAFIISKYFKSVDIRKCGSGNPGATNVFRSVSKPLGILTFVLDALKGFIPVYFAGFINPSIYFILAVALVTVIGHVYTVFLNFKGGKGVATGCGVFIAFAPMVTVICFLIFAITLFISKYVALSSMFAAIALPIILKIFNYQDVIVLFAVILAMIVIIRHLSNIKRILNGTENKIVLKKKEVKQI
ncbi:MAG: glycerol-3-phosphate 1-O-acyltransferase PlsY [Endomicrobiaceae bacterium]|nr:glycerol-3-phosphate 1-O-acyltransferase PlsY [Endomicrobiaceae bacterium]